MELNEIRKERRKKILNYLIREYIFSGKPVASGYLMRKYRLSCSSATIRNDFVFLEREGFIRQPHISAGRVPTEHGYRQYLDSLKRIPPLSKEIEKEIYLFYRDSEKEVEDLIKKTAMILNKLTNYSSLVYAPFFGEDRFKHLDLVFLSSSSLLLVLITNTGRVLKKVVDFDFKVRPVEVDYVERKLNSFFSRMKLAEIKGIIKKRMHPFDENEEKKMKITEKVFNELLKIVFEEEEKNIFT
ncbi:MAG: hypothetical protein KAS39_08685, partial [Actinomycetia bacterium]|nr:hypothetical protein [Actinomycetes bacterium]